MSFPAPQKKAMIFEDERLYACLASRPIAPGHTVVAWKKNVTDLGKLSERDYAHLMDCVDHVRSALQKTLGVAKVYLLYMDEVKHVHWHLVPRYERKGVVALASKPKKLRDFSLAASIRKHLKIHGPRKKIK